MKYSINYKMISMVFAFGALSGCGTYVPAIQELPGSPDDGQLLVREIVRSVHCEVQRAVQYVINTDKDLAARGINGGKRLTQWMDTWGVQIALNLAIVENSSLNPGVTFNTPIIPANVAFPGTTSPISMSQSYNFGIGATLSSEATRIDKVGAYYTVQELLKDKLNCEPANVLQGSLLLESDLKTREWLATLALIHDTGEAGGPFKSNVISHEVKFEIVSDGNITPSWKLVRVSANQGAPFFFGTSRNRTHDLIITFAPNVTSVTPSPPTRGAYKAKQLISVNQPSQAGSNAQLASEIGLAVANGLRTLP